MAATDGWTPGSQSLLSKIRWNELNVIDGSTYVKTELYTDGIEWARYRNKDGVYPEVIIL